MYDNIRSNLFKEAPRILHCLAEHYETGSIESPEANHLIMSLIALVAEGKVNGKICPDTGGVLWSIEESFKKEMESRASENLIRGPW